MAKILVIDDDSTIIELLAVKLQSAGYKVVAAMDGMAASTVAVRERPDLIILDYNMPAANGAKVRERLRGSSFTATTPILLLTASPLDLVAPEMGNDALLRFMRKPVDFKRLTALIADMLGQAAPSRTPEAAEILGCEHSILDLD